MSDNIGVGVSDDETLDTGDGLVEIDGFFHLDINENDSH